MNVNDMYEGMLVAVVGGTPKVSKGMKGNVLGLRNTGLVAVELKTGATADVPPKMLIGVL